MNKVKLLRIKQAAELLGVAPLTLRRWDKSGRLKAIRIGLRNDRRYERKKLLFTQEFQLMSRQKKVFLLIHK